MHVNVLISAIVSIESAPLAPLVRTSLLSPFNFIRLSRFALPSVLFCDERSNMLTPAPTAPTPKSVTNPDGLRRPEARLFDPLFFFDCLPSVLLAAALILRRSPSEYALQPARHCDSSAKISSSTGTH
jgi:hypothetical protein